MPGPRRDSSDAYNLVSHYQRIGRREQMPPVRLIVKRTRMLLRVAMPGTKQLPTPARETRTHRELHIALGAARPLVFRLLDAPARDGSASSSGRFTARRRVLARSGCAGREVLGYCPHGGVGSGSRVDHCDAESWMGYAWSWSDTNFLVLPYVEFSTEYCSSRTRNSGQGTFGVGDNFFGGSPRILYGIWFAGYLK